MKRISIFLFSILIALSCFSQAVITFNQTTHNFGTFYESNPIVKFTFKYKNTGDKPLIIHQVISSCGCTVPTFTKKPIAPGDSGSIKITYNGEGKFPGHFKKVITIRTNAKNKMTRLFVEGDMIIDKKKKNN